MESIGLKFAIQGADENLTGASEAAVEQINQQWARFRVSADALEEMALDPSATFFEQNRIVMFIYLPPDRHPVRAVGQISFCERSHSESDEMYSVVAEFTEIADEDRKRLAKHLETVLKVAAEERRKAPRRQTDLFLHELSRTLGVLARMAEGRKDNFSKQFARLKGLKRSVGRRLEDQKLAHEICSQVEELAANLARQAGGKMGLRKIKIRKLTGKDETSVPKDEVFIGWEEAPLRLGKSYCLYLEGGGTFRSAVVTQILKGYFRTRNSLYKMHKVNR